MMIRRPHVLELVLSFAIGLLGLAVSVWGQDSDSGAIQGWVLDEAGAPLPGVTVQLSSSSMPVERVSVFQPSGGYRFSALPPGHYRLEARLPAFSPAVVDNVRVSVNKTSFISLVLRLETMACEVVVTADAPALRPWKGSARNSVFQAQATVQTEISDGDVYAPTSETGFLDPRSAPLSTFSVDVDTASYANVRRFLQVGGTLPPLDAVRIEEMLNYFTYDYPAPQGGEPFSVSTEIAEAPWKPQHRLLRIGLKGKELEAGQRVPSNLVFLIDVSGSMQPEDRLPLLQKALKTLVVNLGRKDRVAIVVYAGASGLVLPPTSQKPEIFEALNRLQAGGSTNGGEGIELAYAVAKQSFVEGGNNRVILATDGDFNVGMTSESELTRLIEEKAKTGVFLSVLGVGRGNLDDAAMEKLADRGNGNYAYLDTLAEARKVLVRQMGGTLFTIAKDVKVQVELNPAQVAGYRLIGYENRRLQDRDFNDDEKDAGEIGAGHTVTVLYEIVPAGQPVPGDGKVDRLKYQTLATSSSVTGEAELCTLKLRYKDPQGSASRRLEQSVKDTGQKLASASADFKLAAAVASFGMLLRGSEHKGSSSYEAVLALAREGLGPAPDEWRKELLVLIDRARQLDER